MSPDNQEQIKSLKKLLTISQAKHSLSKKEPAVNADIESLQKALSLWQAKRAEFEKELAVSANAGIKFELRERIKECQQEIARLTEEINLLQQKSFKKNSETIDDAMRRVLSRHRTPEETRDAVVTSLRYLIEQPKLKEDTVQFVLDTAINNLNKDDGRTSQPNTQIDKAFYKVLHSSHFAQLCYERLLQGYINANGERRIAIAGILFYKLATKTENLDGKNVEGTIIPLLINLVDLRLDEAKRVEAGLKLVEAFFKPQVYSLSGRKDFVPPDLLPKVIEALFSVLRRDIRTRGDNAIAYTTIWAFGWLTSAKYCHFYPHKEQISASQFNLLRKVIEDESQDPFSRSWSALILSVCAAKNHLFTQADWIYEWAVIADGGKSKSPNLKTINFSNNSNNPNVMAIKNLMVEEKIPVRVKKSAAISLGRLEYFSSEMFELLLSAFQNKTLSSDDRDEALFYLVMIGDPQVISALEEGMESKDNTDQYGLKERCFLALNSIGNDAARSKRSLFAQNQDKFISQQGHQIHKLKAKDSTGRWAYYFVYVESRNEQAFLDALESNANINLENFGQVVGSCYGEQPNDELRALLKNKYGFSV